MWSRLTRAQGRTSFGVDAAAYDAARPEYPVRIFEILRDRCGLGPGTAAFEIGAGTGIATRELLRHGADPVTIVEADPRMVRYLRRTLGRAAGEVTIVPALFEKARLPPAAFDLGVSATAFHWMNERRALAKVARLLKPGGWWAAWWNCFGDPKRPTAFQKAVDHLFEYVPTGPSSQLPGRLPPQLDRPAREAALRRTGRFRRIGSTVVRWELEVPTPRLVALHATYGVIHALPVAKRRHFLREIGRVADEQFGGRVTIRMLTPIYTAQRS